MSVPVESITPTPTGNASNTAARLFSLSRRACLNDIRASSDDSVTTSMRSLLFRKAAVANLGNAVPALLRFLRADRSWLRFRRGGGVCTRVDFLARLGWRGSPRAVPFRLFFLPGVDDIQILILALVTKSSQVWSATGGTARKGRSAIKVSRIEMMSPTELEAICQGLDSLWRVPFQGFVEAA